MKPPQKIYAKVEVQNGEEVLRMSTSPFLEGNIEYEKSCYRYVVETQHWGNHDSFLITMFDPTIHHIIGSVCVNDWPGEKESYIHSLYVSEPFRRRGIAKTLLQIADGKAAYKPIIAQVERDAPAWLQQFYLNRGYKVRYIE